MENENFPYILHNIILDREKPQRTTYFQHMFKNWFHEKSCCSYGYQIPKKKEKKISYIDFVQNYYKSLHFPPWMNHYIDINSNNHDIHVDDDQATWSINIFAYIPSTN